MQTTADDGRAQQLDLVLGLVRTRTTAVRRDALERFVIRYFGQVDSEDLAERAPADLYGAALSHWNFARKREPGHARVRVFNPSVEDDGWQSTHTIIEIVNDDMPFLVDSVTMEVNRHGLTLHLIVHPIIAVIPGADGTLADVAPEDARDARRESFIHVEVDRVIEPARLAALARESSTFVRRRCRRTSWRRARRSCPGSPTRTSRSSGTAATIWSWSTGRTR
jgi:glutamate dehydrogenase